MAVCVTVAEFVTVAAQSFVDAQGSVSSQRCHSLDKMDLVGRISHYGFGIVISESSVFLVHSHMWVIESNGSIQRDPWDVY